MKSRAFLSLALLCAFVLGLLCVRPAAQAMQTLAITLCKNKSACLAYVNTAKARSGVGIAGVSLRGLGLAGISGTPPPGPPSTAGAGDGVVGEGPAYGVVGESASSGVLGVSSSTLNTSAAVVANAPAGANMFQGAGEGTAFAAIDKSGNMQISGEIFTAGQCKTGCIARRVVSYGASAATPTIEDAGEAVLRGGAAYVHLDPAFVNAIDSRQGYLVLITPEGPTTGVYVANRSWNGFSVRENLGGHSNAPFAYRIVAHPYGVNAPRLPAMAVPRPIRR